MTSLCLIPRWGRSPGGGHGNPLQQSCLENPSRQRSLVGYSPWGRTELDTTKATVQPSAAACLPPCLKLSFYEIPKSTILLTIPLLLVSLEARKGFLAIRIDGEPAAYHGGIRLVPIFEEIKVVRTTYNLCLKFSENR